MYAFWTSAQEAENEERKFQMQVHGIGVGDDKNRFPATKQEAEDLIEDPLKDFPNDDLDYSAFTAEVLSQLASDFKRFRKACGRKELTAEETEFFWTPERMDAFNGDNDLARRCSVNGGLWTVYLHLTKLYGDEPDIELLKSLINDDITLARLYPNSMDMMRYRNEFDANILNTSDPKSGTTLDIHIKHLHETGELRDILLTMKQSGVDFPKELIG